jgi:nicotinate-nucleotide adenylyltransferase
VAPATIAVFGGSFDPPHSAHLEVLGLIRASGLADRTLVVPCIRHAFAKQMAAYEHRLAMCRLLCQEAGPGAEASDIEQRLGLSGLTFDMLEAIAGENPGAGLRLVIGADILGERVKWHRFDDIRSLAPPLVVARTGYDDDGTSELPAPAPISSSEVRGLISRGADPGDMVPAAVLRYIEAHGLYGAHQP